MGTATTNNAVEEAPKFADMGILMVKDAVMATIIDKSFTNNKGEDVPYREGMMIVGTDVYPTTIGKGVNVEQGKPFTAEVSVKAVKGQGSTVSVRFRLILVS